MTLTLIIAGWIICWILGYILMRKLCKRIPGRGWTNFDRGIIIPMIAMTAPAFLFICSVFWLTKDVITIKNK